MAALQGISKQQLAIIVGVATSIAWLVLPWKLAMVITLAGGALLSLRSTMEDSTSE